MRNAIPTILLLLAATVSVQGASYKVGDEVPGKGGLDFSTEAGHKLKLRMIDLQFFAFFEDEEGMLAEPPIEGLIVHVTPFNNRNREERVYLSPAGAALTSPRRFPPPPHFFVRVFVPSEGNEEPEFLGRKIFHEPVSVASGE